MRKGGRSLSVFNFGKQHTDQIDDGYLQWLVSEFPTPDFWWKAAASALKQQTSPKINVHYLLSELKYCTRKRDLPKGRGLHTNAIKAGIGSNIYVGTALITLYNKCGSMEEARTVFNGIQDPDVVCWNALISGYVENRQGFIALDLFSRMKDEGKCAPDSFTYLAALKACTLLASDAGESGKVGVLKMGRRIHLEIGHNMDHFVQSTLINLYSKCGSMDDAKTVFESIKEPDVTCWNAIILGYADNRQGLLALELFSKMKDDGRCRRDSVTYLAALKACTLLAAVGGESGKSLCLKRGKEIHLEIGSHINPFAQSTLINLYSKCGNMQDARKVFDSIQKPDVVAWTAIILGYAENGEGSVAFYLFSRMKDNKCTPNTVTYLAVLKGCTLLATDGGEPGKRMCLEMGRQIHLEIGCHMNHFVKSTLINLYAKCGGMVYARTVFDSIQEPDVVCWNALIFGYAENGEGSVALELFSRMKYNCSCGPDSNTYLAALKACTSLAAVGCEAGKRECLQRGRQIHLQIGCRMNHFVQNALINLYTKCGSMEDSRTLFDSIQEPDVGCWNALILGYANSGEVSVALDLFSRMKDEGRCAPDSVTYLAALKACTFLAADGGKREGLERGRQIHSEIGRHMNHFVQCTLINLYEICGSMEDARALFDSIEEPDVVCWTAIIMGYADNGHGLVALDLFSRMKDVGRCTPDSVTYLAALKACCLVGALAFARRIHSVIRIFESHVVTCLVDFYAKCGHMEEAREVFDLHPQVRVVSTWTALLAGYAEFGDIASVFSLFEAMQEQGYVPDSVTFVCMLSCCSHAGLIEKAWHYLEVMPARYELTPTVVHYNCMVDLLGRANKLDEAVALLQKMPCDPNAVTWTALLGACHKWKNVQIGRLAFKSLMNLDQRMSHVYVLMAEIYGSRGMWEEQEWVLETGMKFVGIVQEDDAAEVAAIGH